MRSITCQRTYIRQRPCAAWSFFLAWIALASPAAVAAPPIGLDAEKFAAAESDSADEWVQPSCGQAASDGLRGQCATCQGCNCGRDVCRAAPEAVTEEKSCWKDRCEKVCVPAIHWPWEPGGSKLTLFSWLAPDQQERPCGCRVACVESGCRGGAGCGCCASKCGPVRCVNLLEKESREVTTWKCKWEIRRLPACCAVGRCDCDSGGGIPSKSSGTPAADGVLPTPSR